MDVLGREHVQSECEEDDVSMEEPQHRLNQFNVCGSERLLDLYERQNVEDVSEWRRSKTFSERDDGR